MNEPIERLSDLFDRLKDYISIQIKITTLTLAEKTSRILAKIVSNIIIAFLAVFVLFFLSFAAAFAIGRWVESYAMGFLAVGVFYLIVALFFASLKNKIFGNPLVNVFIKMFLDKSKDDYEDETNY